MGEILDILDKPVMFLSIKDKLICIASLLVIGAVLGVFGLIVKKVLKEARNGRSA